VITTSTASYNDFFRCFERIVKYHNSLAISQNRLLILFHSFCNEIMNRLDPECFRLHNAENVLSLLNQHCFQVF
jgi:hypothetical protein